MDSVDSVNSVRRDPQESNMTSKGEGSINDQGSAGGAQNDTG